MRGVTFELVVFVDCGVGFQARFPPIRYCWKTCTRNPAQLSYLYFEVVRESCIVSGHKLRINLLCLWFIQRKKNTSIVRFVL
jgi:hypothetical protein